MREIKFRAWIARDPYEETPVMEMCYDLAFEEYEPINDLLANQDNLMQYTGLKDKNGVEIYEGDIVLDGYKGKYGRYEVQWHKSTARWGFNSTDGRELEIIGNIYENC